jgi:hypothetical protein
MNILAKTSPRPFRAINKEAASAAAVDEANAKHGGDSQAAIKALR